jgi:hypothetical protein
MKGYKGFNDKMQCTPNNKIFQFATGKTYEHTGKVQLCKSGFHFCENPLDVFAYYPPMGKFADVEADGVPPATKDATKRVAKKLTIGAELSLSALIGLGVKFILEKVDFTNAKESNTGDRSAATNTGNSSAATNTGDSSAATNTGDRSAATNTGDRSAATNTGDRSAATNTGDSSAATNTGDRSAATNTGNSSAATNTGDRSAATNTGYRSAATNTGDSSAATNTGDSSAATNTGDSSAATNTGDSSAATNTGNSSAATNTGDSSAATNTGDRSAATNTGLEGCAISIGIDAVARGAMGCWLTLAEWEFNKKESRWHRVDVQTKRVNGKSIKPDTYYSLKNGRFVKTDWE